MAACSSEPPAATRPPDQRRPGPGWPARPARGLLALGVIVTATAARAVEGTEALERALAACPDRAAETCLSTLEAAALKSSGSRAERAGSRLTVQTERGPMRFDDRPGVVTGTRDPAPPPTSPRYYYLGGLDGSDAQLVLALPPGAALRAARYWLVGAAGPPALALDALPWPAPDGRLLVVAKPAEAGEPTALSTLALYLRVNARWTQPYRYEAPVGVSYRFKSWRADGAAVRLEWAISGPTKACADRGEHGSIQLRDGPYGWDLVPPLPPLCR